MLLRASEQRVPARNTAAEPPCWVGLGLDSGLNWLRVAPAGKPQELHRRRHGPQLTMAVAQSTCESRRREHLPPRPTQSRRLHSLLRRSRKRPSMISINGCEDRPQHCTSRFDADVKACSLNRADIDFRRPRHFEVEAACQCLSYTWQQLARKSSNFDATSWLRRDRPH